MKAGKREREKVGGKSKPVRSTDSSEEKMDFTDDKVVKMPLFRLGIQDLSKNVAYCHGLRRVNAR